MSFNLQKNYDLLNKHLFDNELPQIPLGWEKSKKRAGVLHTIITRSTRTRTVTIKKLSLSNFYNFTDQQYLDTLAHEMIHVWQVTTQTIDLAHGIFFRHKMKEINDKHFMNIVVTESDSNENLEVASKKPVSFYGVIVLTPGKDYFAFDLLPTKNVVPDEIIDYCKRKLVSGTQVYITQVYITHLTDPKWKRASYSRGLTKLKWKRLDNDEAYDAIEHNFVKKEYV